MYDAWPEHLAREEFAVDTTIVDGNSTMKHIIRSVARWICTPIRLRLDRLFADEDANAVAHGWQIQRLPRGGRRYRDPRWDTVRDDTETGSAPSAHTRPEVPR